MAAARNSTGWAAKGGLARLTARSPRCYADWDRPSVWITFRRVMKLLAAAFVVIVIVFIGVLYLSFDSFVERGIETLGPSLTGTTVEVEEVDISPISGRGSLRGMVVANPQGSKAKYAFRLPEVHLWLAPLSILRDKIIVREVVAESPLVNYEKQGETTNLERLTDSVQAAIGGSDAKRLQIDRFELRDARVRATGQVLDGRPIEVPPLSVELTDLGTDPKGATVAEVSAEVIQTVKKRATGEVAKTIATLGLGKPEAANEVEADEEAAAPQSTEADEAPQSSEADEADGVETEEVQTDQGPRRRRRPSRRLGDGDERR